MSVALAGSALWWVLEHVIDKGIDHGMRILGGLVLNY
jgi:hypothetical protein